MTTEPNKNADVELDPATGQPFDATDPVVEEQPSVTLSLELEDLVAGLGTEEADLEPDGSERPTVAPPFDVEIFAKTAVAEGGADNPQGSQRATMAPPFDMEVYAQVTMVGPSLRPAGPWAASESSAPAEADMLQRFARGDFAGALTVAESMLEADPGCVQALECAESSRSKLEETYTEQIGPLRGIPTMTVGRDQLQGLSLDHRAGFMLSLVDGVSTVSLILDISGMERLEGLRILSELIQQHVISVRAG